MTDAKNWLIWKDPDAGKDWKQEEKGTTEDEMVKAREAWRAAIHGVTKNRRWLSDWTEIDDGQMISWIFSRKEWKTVKKESTCSSAQ